MDYRSLTENMNYYHLLYTLLRHFLRYVRHQDLHKITAEIQSCYVHWKSYDSYLLKYFSETDVGLLAVVCCAKHGH